MFDLKFNELLIYFSYFVYLLKFIGWFQSYKQHQAEKDPERIQEIIKRSVEDGEWVLRKVNFGPSGFRSAITINSIND